ncbi:DNA-processing protein DprA [Streptomyces sp. NPDC059003]|uniref:DNA-processing protein DprA n=1 Tax=Streptomyces sp. NPDC059003 TaxID=3346691 RepID=UPI0036785A14
MRSTAPDSRAERVTRICLIHAVGHETAALLLEKSTAVDAIEALRKRAAHGGTSQQTYTSIINHRDFILNGAEAEGARFLLPGDAEWPEALNALDPTTPLGLLVRGKPSLAEATARSVAITGTNAPTQYGTDVAETLAYELADMTYSVITALISCGISHAALLSAAHGGTAQAVPVAVCSAGLHTGRGAREQSDHIVAEGGLVVSMYAQGVPTSITRQQQRQELMAHLSLGTVIVEDCAVNKRAAAAEAAGRPVFAVPGPIDSPQSNAVNRLIRDRRAYAITEARDIDQVLTHLREDSDTASQPTAGPATRTGDV